MLAVAYNRMQGTGVLILLEDLLGTYPLPTFPFTL
jgi:hypothetical protein